MSRTKYSLFSLLVVGLMGTNFAQASENVALDEVRGKIGEMFSEIEPQDVDVSPVEGWYTIQKGSVVAYVSADGRYLLQGDMIDLDQQLNLSEQVRTNARRDVLASLTDDNVIAFSPQKVKHTVTVFTDVECTYCRKLHGQIDEYLAQGIEVRYLLYPRGGPASRSWKTSEEVWCASDRNDALTAAKQGRPFESHSCDVSAITDHYMLGQDIGLTGTPAIVLEDGTLLSGYLPPEALASRLQLVEQTAANH